MSRALTKQLKLEQVKRLLLTHPEGISITDLQKEVDPESDWSSMWRFVTQDLKARKIERGVYTLDPSSDDIALALAVLQRANNGHQP